MLTHITSRHFKAHETLLGYAQHAVDQLSHFFDGIIRADVTLSFEKTRKSTKVAEVRVSVYNAVLVGVSKTDDFFKSIDTAVAKVLAQLKKYKSKLREKDRTRVRKVRGKVTV
ncbi:MAG TPA: ribosome-associated translation inhibitor RaiA [Bacteroidota bacterium]